MGIDVSELMLKLAIQKAPAISWFLGNIEALPFADNSFDGATCVLAIHHLQHLQSAFKESARVITNGSLVIFTATAEQMEGYWLNEYFPEAMKKSILQMPGENLLLKLLGVLGFGDPMGALQH